MSFLYDLFRRNFPFAVREEQTARDLLEDPRNTVFTRKNAAGELIAACVLRGNTVFLLCVDAPYRRQGIGSSLLAQAEEAVRAAGYDQMTIGAGEDYLTPGVPVNHPIVSETLAPDRLDASLEDHSAFFLHRGYSHAWDCNCFDMRADFADGMQEARRIDGVCLRFAQIGDRENTVDCVKDGYEPFAQYYAAPALYGTDPARRILIACEEDKVVGALIVSFGTEGERLGSVGCTVVRETSRGRGIAAELVKAGTAALRDAGMASAYLGYTYTGLDRLYGRAGYRISCYYFMARKQLPPLRRDDFRA